MIALVCASLLVTLFLVPASAASSDDLLVFSITNWRGYVPYTYLGFFDDAAGSLDQLHYYLLNDGSSDYVLRFDIPKVVHKGDKFVFSGEMVIHESVRTFTPTCTVPATLQVTSSYFIDPETTEGFYKYNFVLSATIPADTTEFDAFIMITSSPAQSGFYLRKVSYSLNGDPSVSINENADKNTSEIINNQNQNTQDIIDNNNSNTQSIVQNEQNLQENEKNEANDGGNSGVNQLEQLIPNESDGFISAFQGLISAASYNGTECNWTLPSIKLPAIDGVMDEIVLTEDMEIDFEFWIGEIPTSVMMIVKSLLTAAIMVFGFKELYSLISYILTLKGGGGN